MVTRDSLFKSPPSIPIERFVAEMHAWKSPWADKAVGIYNLIVSQDHDPAKWLAVGIREHRLLTDPDAVALKLNTNSWTNARSVRLDSLDYDIITTQDLRRAGINNRKGPYVRYRSVEDSLRDGMYRIEDQSYVYWQRYGPDITIAEVFGLWTEDDPEGYINFVVNSVNEWIEEPPMTAQIPGFKWEPADDRHHTKGRTSKISGFAVHYTGRPTPNGSSLNWLTKHPNSNVSATFLIRHRPTMEDRGWQLVRIEDTPHTTGEIVNPFTVSFEYELMFGQSVSDEAYQVMAQTILDVIAYVAEHKLGEIMLNREGIKGHREWTDGSTICPDGVDVDRIVRIAQGKEGSERIFPETGFAIRGRIRARWEDIERAGLVFPLVGYPLSDEYEYQKDGSIVVRQRFERCIMEYVPELEHPWDVTSVFVRDIPGFNITRERLHLIGEELVDLGEELTKA